MSGDQTNGVWSRSDWVKVEIGASWVRAVRVLENYVTTGTTDTGVTCHTRIDRVVNTKNSFKALDSLENYSTNELVSIQSETKSTTTK